MHAPLMLMMMMMMMSNRRMEAWKMDQLDRVMMTARSELN